MRLFARTNGADVDADAAETDFARRGADGSRRRLLVVAVVAVTAVVAVAVMLAIHQYTNAQHAALTDLRTRAALTAAIINVAINGDISALETSPPQPRSPRSTGHRCARTFRGRGGAGEPVQRRLRLDRPRGSRPDQHRRSEPRAAREVTDRTYFRHVRADGTPYVTGGLIGRRNGHAIIAVAVPTRAAAGSAASSSAASSCGR